MNTYSWKNSEFKSVDAARAASSLEEVRHKHGELKPALVVDAARNKKHPLHDLFPWDDAEAAQIGREAIAARIIRSIRVQIVTPDRKTIDTRAFVSSRDPSAKGSRSYTLTESALESEEGRAFLIRQAWLQLRAWRRKYAELSELAEVFDAIDRVSEKTG